MIGQILTSSELASGQMEITDPRVAALFVKPHVAGYLAQFIGAETTVKRAALRVNTKLNVMAYWAERFLNLGLILVARVESRAGSAVKVYQSVAREFIISVDRLEGLTNNEVLQRIMHRHYDPFSENVAASGLRLTDSWQLRLFRDATGYGLHLEPIFQQPPPQPLPRRALHDWADITLPAREAAEFHQELAELFERFKGAVSLEPNLPRFMMHVGFVELV